VSTLSTSHSIQLTGLTASTTYHFRVRSQNATPTLTISGDNTFTTPTPDTTPPTVTGRTPAAGATGVWTTAPLTATFSEPVQSSTISFVLRDSVNVVVPATLTYDAPSLTATLQPNAALRVSSTYTATVSGTADLAGNVMTSTSWSFTTTATSSACPCSIWSSTTTPGTASHTDTGAVELGVKFRSNVAGQISGIRFYKGSANTGTHIGNLWTVAGTLLATATFAGESPTGWQQVNFTTPVSITANTTYVASYYAPAGGYARDASFFTGTTVINGPLQALADGTDGPNGVYGYGSTSGFPSSTYQATNYWVDVIFR
jgi:hypothetical protein